MMRWISLLFFTIFTAFQLGASQPSPDFMTLMGKGKRCWKFVKKREDVKQLELFQESFLRNYSLLFEHNQETPLIPHVIHLIWLGPKEFPFSSEHNIRRILDLHPDWTIKFWSDRERRLIDPRIELKVFDTSYLDDLAALYDMSDNFGERSDILRLTILYKEGGLYLDHDVECRRSFTSLHDHYDFYTGLQTLGNPIIKSGAVVRNSIIGSAAGHPLIKYSLGLTAEYGPIAHERYPGLDVSSTISRVTYSAFKAFHDAVTETVQDPAFTGIVFPAGYFNTIDGEFGWFADESMTGSWYKGEMTYYEQYLHKRLHKMTNRLYYFMFGSSVLIITNLLLLFYFIRRGRALHAHPPSL